MKSLARCTTVLSLAIVTLGPPLILAQETGPDERVSVAQSLVQAMAEGNFAAAVRPFDSTMAALMPEAKLRETWAALLTQVGAYRQQGATRIQKIGVYDAVFVTTEFERATIDVRVVLNGARQIAGLFFQPSRPPAVATPVPYAKPDAFSEQAVTVGSGDWALPGTLAMPSGAGPFPAIVLVHGSGPNDRDETLGPNKPFRDLAQGLASRGVAVLRYDKRTLVHGPKLAGDANLTVKAEVIDDAAAAVSLLLATPHIDGQRIFLLGHSLGGTLAPRIGVAVPRLAGLVILAGATRPIEDIIPAQLSYIASLKGEVTSAEQEQIDSVRAAAARVKALTASDAGSPKRILGAPASYWLDLRAYAPAATAAKLGKPMLILQGERDYQVTMEDFAGWKQALAGRSDVRFMSYPALNHLFIAGQGKSGPAEYEEAGHVAEAVVADIAAWISRQGPGSATPLPAPRP